MRRQLVCGSSSRSDLSRRFEPSPRLPSIDGRESNVVSRITETRAAYLPSLSVTAQTGTSLVPGTLRARTDTCSP
jgi:hypothetical protein